MSSPSTRADSKVSRPTTAPDHIARAAARVLLGKAALQDQADRAAGEDGASDGERKNFRIHSLSPKDGSPKHVWWPFARTGRKRAAQIARCVNRATLLIRRNFRPLSWPDAGTCER